MSALCFDVYPCQILEIIFIFFFVNNLFFKILTLIIKVKRLEVQQKIIYSCLVDVCEWSLLKGCTTFRPYEGIFEKNQSLTKHSSSSHLLQSRILADGIITFLI